VTLPPAASRPGASLSGPSARRVSGQRIVVVDPVQHLHGAHYGSSGAARDAAPYRKPRTPRTVDGVHRRMCNSEYLTLQVFNSKLPRRQIQEGGA
jgi:hypothetical protein